MLGSSSQAVLPVQQVTKVLDDRAPALDRVPSRTGGRMATSRSTRCSGTSPPEPRRRSAATVRGDLRGAQQNAEIGGFLADADERGRALQQAVAEGLERMMAQRDAAKIVDLAEATGPNGALAVLTATGEHLINNGDTVVMTRPEPGPWRWTLSCAAASTGACSNVQE